jgi:hypothetical protein
MTKRILVIKDYVVKFLFVALSIILIVSDAIGRAGGGGGMTVGGGSASRAFGHGGSIPIWVLIFPAIILLYLLIWYLRWSNKKRSTRQMLKEIAQKDPVWNEERIAVYVKDHFTRTQEAWCAQKLDILRDLLHPEIFREWQAKIEDQILRGTKNVMESLSIQQVQVVDVKNFRDNVHDQFTAYIKACASDATYDIRGNIISKRDPGIFEFWTYTRLQDRWVLRRIDSGDKDGKFLKPNINED